MADQESMLAKVRALLTKAEHPATPEAEADALTAKAAALMAKYGIDEAMAAARENRREMPERQVIVIDDPYATAKSILLNVIVQANRCRAVQMRSRPVRMYVYGFKPDLEATEMLYTSLLLQMANGLARTRATGYQGQDRTRSARRAYILGFASAVSSRLQKVRKDSETVSAQPGTAVVLASRDLAVNGMFENEHPNARSRPVSLSNRDGYASGYAAGQRADVGGTRIGRGAGRALSK
jgi:hypothetical protein